MTFKRILLCPVLLAALLLPACRTATPGLSWEGLEDGQTVYGIVHLVVIVTGRVDEVSFSFGDGQIGPGKPESASVYSCDWYTQESANGNKVVRAQAIRAGEALAEAHVSVTVANRPRTDLIPGGVVKMTPANDAAPPRLAPAFKVLWEEPVPMPGPVNTTGAEDSPFVTPDGNTFYFFFTGDPGIDVHTQALDPWTGIYWTRKAGGQWQEPQRLFLQHWNKIGLDGDPMQRGDTLWFGSIRAGNYRDIDLWTAKLVDGRWVDWANAGEALNKTHLIGELHVSADGNEIYCGSTRPGGKGQSDIWVSRKVGGQWQPPENVAAVNSEGHEGQPFLSEDSNELWFTRLTPGPAIYRSVKVNGEWQPPELVLDNLAGEPTLDAAGNLYFVHHRWDSALNQVTEADIYVCRRKEAAQ